MCTVITCHGLLENIALLQVFLLLPLHYQKFTASEIGLFARDTDQIDKNLSQNLQNLHSQICV